MIAVALLALAIYFPLTLYPQSDAAHTVFRVAVCLAAVRVALPEGRLVRVGLALWAVGIVASVVLAPDPWRAMWSTHNRQEGAWQAAHYLVLVFVAAAVGRDLLPRWVAIGAALSAAWGIVPTIGWVDGRLAGSTGNPLYLAPLLLMGVWGAWRASWTRRFWTGGWKWSVGAALWAALAATLALCALATGSKGVVVAALAAGGALVHTRFPRLFYAGAVGLAVGLWFVPVPDSGLIRLELGRVALHGIASQPLGWGAEGFPLVWDTFWRGASATGEAWHDRAHSLPLDRAIEWGVVGLVGWLAVVVAAWRRAELPERAAIAAYVGFGLTMFEMMWGAAGFAVLLGYTLRGRVVRVGKPAWAAAAVALVVGSLALAQSRAMLIAPAMAGVQRAIERFSPVGGDLIELYLKTPQTADTLDWADGMVETRSPRRTQQAFLLAAWDRRYCADLRSVAPKRPDVVSLCHANTP